MGQRPPARGRRRLCLRGGASLERPREAEDVLGYVGEDEVGGDGGHLEEPGLAELALDVVLGVVAVAAVGLHRDVGRLPRGVGGEELGHVRLGPAGLSPVEELRDRKSTRLNSSHANISYAVFCLKKKTT